MRNRVLIEEVIHRNEPGKAQDFRTSLQNRLLEGHSPDLESGFLHPFDWNKPTPDSEHDDPGVDYLRFISTQQSPVLPGGMGSNDTLEEFLALRAEDLSNKLLLAGRRALIHPVQRLPQFPFDESQIVIHRGVGERQADCRGQ